MLNRTSGYVLLRSILPGLILSLVCSTQVNASSPSIQQDTSTDTSTSSTKYAYRATDQIRHIALELVNHDRAGQGLAPLVEDRLLSSAAELHALDMARRGYFDHYNPKGQGPTERFIALGGNSPGVAENIVYTFHRGNYPRVTVNNLREFQQRWMNSTPHRRNLLNSRYKSFGYGVAISPDGSRIYAVQLFGLP
jgi:uncharacterized protein YkwD